MPIALCLVLIFCIWLNYEIHKHEKTNQKSSNEFWEREYQSNFIRSNHAEDYNKVLDFVTIPEEELPFTQTEDETLASMQNQVKNLVGQKIAKLSPYTNTDLKFKFGTASITALTRFDDNFILLSRTIARWGDYLYQTGNRKDAQTVLEYGISIHTDVSGNYKTLALIYKEQGNQKQLEQLIQKAQTLETLTKDALLESLNTIQKG